MQSKSFLTGISKLERLKEIASAKWEGLGDRQKIYLKKIWGVLTYKWRWQIAMNVPYLAIFALDRTIPSVHQFNVDLLSSVAARLPIPEFMASAIGLS